jgi:hypothetical protein
MDEPPMPKPRVCWPAVLGSLLAIGLIVYVSFVYGSTVCDPSGGMDFDPGEPFRLDFGRGSGMHGLDTISIAQDGQTIIHRSVRSGGWEHASLRLTREQRQAIAEAVIRRGLFRLANAYHAPIHDGTQWVLWIRQGEREKAVYFDNSFPRAIRAFADDLDRILSPAGYDQLRWKRTNARTHDDELWKAIR